MKIGIRQWKNKAPKSLRILRSSLIMFNPAVVVFLKETEYVTNTLTLHRVSLWLGLILLIVGILCIVTGVKEDEDKYTGNVR